MAFEAILYTVADRIATITLNRPDRLNAWTPRMSEEVRDAMFQAARDKAVRVIILTGAGRAFCAGADMSELKTATEQGASALDNVDEETRMNIKELGDVRADFSKRYSYFPAIPKPVIGALNGTAVGIGFAITLYCDIRIASQSARFSTLFAQRGLIAEHGMSWMLPKIVGMSNALDMLFSARMVGAEEALRMGLVSRVVPDEQLLEEALSVGTRLSTAVSPRSLKIMKRQIYGAQFQTLAEAIDLADAEMRLSLQSDDFKEGVAHFIEKRPPAFTGK